MEKISWHTIEYIHTPKTSDWYWIVGTITISIAIIAIILNNIIFAILIIISSFTLSLFASRPAQVVEVHIDRNGVEFGKHQYSFRDLDSFWLETRETHPRILLKSKKVFMPLIVVFIEEHSPEDVHRILSQYLKEEEHTEPLLEKLLLYFGF